MLSSDCKESSQQAPVRRKWHRCAQSSHAQRCEFNCLSPLASKSVLLCTEFTTLRLSDCHGARLQATPLHASRLGIPIRVHSPVFLILCKFGFTISGIDCVHVAMHEEQASPPDEKANCKNEELQAKNPSERCDVNVRGQQAADQKEQNYMEMCIPALDDSDK